MKEKYIQFAIDNGYELINTSYSWLKVECNRIKYLNKDEIDYWYDNLIEVITSEPFIEAIARGVSKKVKYETALEWHIENLTIKQAIAIRDNKLEEFIINLLWEWNQ